MQATENRYDRQERIPAWDQTKLAQAHIAIIGKDALAQQVALSATALGFGKINIYGWGMNTGTPGRNYEYCKGMLNYDGEGKTTVRGLEQLLNNMNDSVHVTGINANAGRQPHILGTPHIIIETTNDPESKYALARYAATHHIPFISATATLSQAMFGMLAPGREPKPRLQENLYFPETRAQPQGPLTSQFIAGIIVDEARKVFLPLQHEQLFDDILVYNLASQQRFMREDQIAWPTINLGNYHILVVGAGALGIQETQQLAMHNIGRITLIDFDRIETTNLNRQIMYYDSVGHLKARTLARKLKQINPDINVATLHDKLTLDTTLFTDNTFDAILDAVDNNKTRALLNHFSLTHGIPLISAGTRYNGGQVTLAIPGRTACLNCQVNIDQLAQEEHRPASCMQAPNASVITVNQTIGAAAVAELIKTLNPELYGLPVTGTLKYATTEDLRVGIMPAARATCTCSEKTAKWVKAMAKIYQEDAA